MGGGAALLLLVSALGFAACGGSGEDSIDTSTIESTVKDKIQAGTVSCPATVAGEKGTHFECKAADVRYFTETQGLKGTVAITLADDQGKRFIYQLELKDRKVTGHCPPARSTAELSGCNLSIS
jgi:hypothetical protein